MRLHTRLAMIFNRGNLRTDMALFRAGGRRRWRKLLKRRLLGWA